MPIIATIMSEYVIVAFVLLFFMMVILVIFCYRKHITIIHSLAEEKQKKEQLSDFMKFFSETLNNTMRLEEVYSLIAKQIANITGAKGVCIYELHNDDYLFPVGYTEAFPPFQLSKKFVLSNPRYVSDSLKYEKIKLGDGVIGETAKSKTGLLLKHASEDKRLKAVNKIIPINTLMSVPMKIDEEVSGVICAINNKNNKPFTEAQFETLDSMTKLVVHSHSILKVYSNQAMQMRLTQELEFTRLLQASLLPKEFPEWKPFVIYAFTRSAKEVNGDFYDFVKIDNDRLLLVIGDASGKGVPACMVMAMTRSFIRANIGRFTNLSDLLTELNANLYRDTNEERFVSLSCCLLDKKEKTMEFARAGHTEMLFYHNKDTVREIQPGGTALGLLPNDFSGSFDSFLFSFKEGYSVMLFSDGITEMTDDNDNEFGLKRLKELFLESCKRKNSPSRCIDKVLRSLDSFSPEKEQADDQTMVIVSHESSFI